MTSNDASDISDEEVQIISQSETPPPPADEENKDDEVQILLGPIPAPIFMRGRKYDPGSAMSRVHGSVRARRGESDSSPEENHTEADLLDSEEDVVEEHATESNYREYRMRRDENFRDYARRRRRSRTSSSDSDTDRRGNNIEARIRRNMYNPYCPPSGCPEVEELGEFVRHMINVGEMAESDDS